MLVDKVEGRSPYILIGECNKANKLSLDDSGMAIQGPGPGGRVVPGQDVVQDILERARE